MKDPSAIRRSTSRPAGLRALAQANRVASTSRRPGLPPWRALDREQFQILVASPRQRTRIKGGSKSC